MPAEQWSVSHVLVPPLAIARAPPDRRQVGPVVIVSDPLAVVSAPPGVVMSVNFPGHCQSAPRRRQSGPLANVSGPPGCCQ